MKKQYEAWYVLLDGSPRNIYPIYAVDEADAREQALAYVKDMVSKDYDPKNIKVKRT